MGAFTYELELLPGLNSDDTTFAARGRWADGNNVRPRLGRHQPIGGWSTLHANAISGANTIYQHPIGNTLWLMVGSSGLFAGENGALPASIHSGSSASDSGWALQSYGSILMAVPRGGTLYEWPGTGSTSEVTQAPDVIMDMLVTPERQVLAFGCNEEVSGDFNGMCIRGSDIEDYTDWTTSPTNNAFEHILSGPGEIVGARLIGNYVAVWTDHALWMGQFIGDPSQAYRFDQVAEGFGLYRTKLVSVVGQTAYWINEHRRPCMWTPGSQPVQITCPILKDFQANIIPDPDLAFAFNNEAFNEVWFFYPDARDELEELPSRYIALCLGETGADGAPLWFRGQIERSAMFGSYGVNAAGTIFTHESGNANRTWYIQSTDQYIESGNRRVMVRSVVPDFEDQTGDVSLTMFVRDYPQGSATTKGPYTLGASARKKDFRASGKLIAVKFSGDGGTFARLGKPTFDCTTMGER